MVVCEHVAVLRDEEAAAAARLRARLTEVVGVGHFGRDGDDLLACQIIDRRGGARVGADRLRYECAARSGGGASRALAGAVDEPRDCAAAEPAQQCAYEAQARDARDEPFLLGRARGPGLAGAALAFGLFRPCVGVRRVVARRGIGRVVAGLEIRVFIAALGLWADDVVGHVVAAVHRRAAVCAEAGARLEHRTALRAGVRLRGGFLRRLRGGFLRRLRGGFLWRLRGGFLRRLRGGFLRCLHGVLVRCLGCTRCCGDAFRLFVFRDIGSVVHVVCLPAVLFLKCLYRSRYL